MIPVIDVSQHQGVIDFSVMRAKGVHHIILRATHGRTIDARLSEYYSAAIQAGYAPHQIGFYSFINPKRGSAQVTAQATADAIVEVAESTDVLYMLDVESYRAEGPNVGTVTLTGQAFADYIREHRAAFQAAMPGCRIIAYTNRAYWNSADGPRDAVLASELEWIVPRYPVYSRAGYERIGYPPEPDRWDEWAFARAPGGPNPPIGGTWDGWQFSAGYNAQGPVYGCASSDLDLNIVGIAAAARWFPEPVVIPDPIPEPPEEEMTTAVIWNPKGYASAFLIGAGDVVHLSPALFEHYVSLNVKVISQDDHPQLLDSVLHATGLTAGALDPL